MKELDKVNTKKRVSSPSNKGFLSEPDPVDSRKKSRRRDRVFPERFTENHLLRTKSKKIKK
jgi:hypothetical protein